MVDRRPLALDLEAEYIRAQMATLDAEAFRPIKEHLASLQEATLRPLTDAERERSRRIGQMVRAWEPWRGS